MSAEEPLKLIFFMLTQLFKQNNRKLTTRPFALAVRAVALVTKGHNVRIRWSKEVGLEVKRFLEEKGFVYSFNLC